MSEEELDEWYSVQFHMEGDGMKYCFESYSDWGEIEDEEFHRLRIGFLQQMNELRAYILKKVEEGEMEEDELD